MSTKEDKAAAVGSAEPLADELLGSAEKKLNTWILPGLTMLSVICYLDRANLSFASVTLNQDLHFSTATYGLGSGLFFLGYALFQIPSNMALSRVGGAKWLATICVVWGIVAGSFAAINSRTSFLILRLCLGIAEAGALPGMWWYVAQFWLPHRMTIPMTLVMAGATMAQVLGAPLAAALLQLDGVGGLEGWRWLFIIEAIPAVLLGVTLWFVLPESPRQARFLTKEEKEALIVALAETGTEHQQEQQEGSLYGKSGEEPNGEPLPEQAAPPQGRTLAHDWASLMLAVRCPIVWCGGVWRMLYAVAVYGFTYFTPLIIKDMLGYTSTSDTRVILLTTIPFACAAAFHMLNGVHSQHVGERRLHIALPWAAGAITLFCLPTATNGSSTAAAFVVLVLACSGVNGADGPDVSWITSLMTPGERLLGLPTINMVANVGGFVGPYVIGALNTASGNYDASEYFMAGCIAVSAGMVLLFPTRWSNVAAGTGAAGAAAASEALAAGPVEKSMAAIDGLSGRSRVPGRQLSRHASTFLAAVAGGCGEALLACPEPVRSRVLPALEPAVSWQPPQLVQRWATFSHGLRSRRGPGAAATRGEAAARDSEVDMQRGMTV